MLSLYSAFKAPGVEHVMVYRDDEAPHKFYLVPERPTIARDDEGDPLFTFLLYARDVQRLAPEEREVERAYLALSAQVAVAPADEQRLRSHLRQQLTDERARGYRFLGQPIAVVEPELGYPPVFTRGTVSCTTFGADLAPFTAGVQAPSLVGTNLASFSQMLSQDGAELFRQSVEQGIVPAIISYELTFVARIPALGIHIAGDRRAFYEELRQQAVPVGYRTSNGQTVTKLAWPNITTLREFRATFHSLTIEIDDGDFRAANPGDEATQKLEELAFRLLEDHILPSFFETAFPPPPPAALPGPAAPPAPAASTSPAATRGSTGAGRANSSPAVPAARPATGGRWLKSLDQELGGSIDVRIRRSDVVEHHVNPNAQLAEVLAPAEIAARTVYVDLSDPYFAELDVTVHANVDFAADPVYALKVFLDYDQQDDRRRTRVKHARELLFRGADEIRRFRQLMARAADGTPKDSYQLWSEIIYKTGETIRVPRQGTITSRERELVISYRRLGFVKVNLVLGSMPDTVRAVHVQLRYPGSSAPSAQQAFELTRERPAATYFTYTGQPGEPGPYVYQLCYVLADGQRMDLPEQSSQAETLTVPDPFEQTVTTRFLAQADFSAIAAILVDARYRDPANDFAVDHHAELTANGATSAWAIGLRDPNHRELEYDTIVVEKSGARIVQPTKRAPLGGTIPVGVDAVDALEVTIIASLVDWTKYQLALVYLEYADPANGVQEDKTFTFRRETSAADQVWRVMLRDRARREYRYRARFLAANSGDNREVDWTTVTDPILVLQ